MLPLILSCMLGAVLLSPCDSESADVSQAYSDVAYAVPAAHLKLIRGLYWIANANRGEANWSTFRLGLSRKPSTYVLAHEAAHLVSAANLPLWDRYRAHFWPGGSPVDGMPTSYARTNPAEDWAESYAHVILRDTADMKVRAEWLLRELPELR